MAELIAELRPLPGRGDVPTLTAYADRRLVVSVPGKAAAEFPIGPGGITALATYVTEVRAPRRALTRQRLYRSGWHLLDGTGRPIVWLGNVERDIYDEADLRDFASAAALGVFDRGALPYAQLLGEQAQSVGPGTSKVTAFVAPSSQWALAGAVLAGIALCGGWFIPDGSPLGVGFGSFFGMFVGAGLLPLVGILLAVHRERRWYAKHPGVALRSADRVPGLAVTATPRELLVMDMFKTTSASRSQGVELVPYDTTQTDPQRWSTRGLAVIENNDPQFEVPAPFGAAELAAFSQTTGIPIGALQTDPSKLPDRPKVKVGEVRLKLARRCGRIHWLALVLWILVPVALVLGVLGLLKVLPIAMSYCIVMIGFAVAIPSAWAVAQNQLSVSVLHPDQISAPQPAPQRGRN